MSIRRMLQVGVVALSIGGAFAPMLSSEAQVTGGDAATNRGATTSADDRRTGPDLGWVGILGLAGLAGLMGTKREDPTLHRGSATQNR